MAIRRSKTEFGSRGDDAVKVASVKDDELPTAVQPVGVQHVGRPSPTACARIAVQRRQVATAYYSMPSEPAGRPFASAVETGWRYVRLGGNAETGDIVEVEAVEGADPMLSGFAEGTLARTISDAGQAAVELLSRDPAHFQPRILRLPEIHMEALWMHADDDDVADRFRGLPNAQRNLVDDAFLEEAIGRARRYLGDDDKDDDAHARV